MYRWLALLFLVFSIAGAGAKDEIPDVVNETAIEPQPSDDDDDDGQRGRWNPVGSKYYFD